MKFLRKINYNYKKFNVGDFGKLLVLIFLMLSMVGCGGKKKGVLPFWMMGLTGSVDGASAGSTGTDQNGVLLPPGQEEDDTSAQEVDTSGAAVIEGQIVPVIGDNPLCLNPPENNSPPGCTPEQDAAIDLTKVTVKLVKNVNGEEVVVATTNPDANGNYNFTIPDLENGNYRVLTNTGEGLNYAYEDILFTHDPTNDVGVTTVNVNDLKPERLYNQSGAAVISGNARTPGFIGDVTIPAGPLSGLTVNLKDKDGNIIASTTTNSSGDYNFCFHSTASCPSGGYVTEDYLNNGSYTVEIKGSTATPQEGRAFEDVSLNTNFKFSGKDQNVANDINMSNANLAWNAATSSQGTINVMVNNAANTDTSTPFTVVLKDSVGNIISTTTRVGSGPVTLTGSDMTGGVYFVEVSNPNMLPTSSSFNFIPHSAGGNKEVTASTLNVVPKPSNVTGSIQGPGGNPNPVPGSVINFKPDGTQPPTNLLYLLKSDDERLRNLATLWIAEGCPSCYANCAAGGFQAQCVATQQANYPSGWNYLTYSNKVYEVNGAQLTMTAVAGKWDYYISAPGYENSSNGTMTLNGQDVNVPPIILTPSEKRSQIKGSVVVRDTQVNGATTNNANVSGLFTVMLGNTNNLGQPVAHITTTANGQFAFDGNSKVIPLTNVPDLDGDGVITDTDRVKYAIGAYASAPLLSSGAGVSGVGASNSVDSTGGFYNFKQSSYQVIVADPLGHILTTPKQADNSSVVTNTYTNGNAILNLNGITVPHISRRQISGTITDAFSTSAVDGATVTLGVMDANNQFQATVRRDCTGGAADATTCTMPTVRTPGSDQVVPSVTTNANGQYQINNIDPGDYVLKISKNGIDTYVPVTVPSNSNTVANAQVITTNGRGNLTGTVRQLNQYGEQVNFTGTYSIELISPIFGGTVRPTSGVMPASLASGPTTFSNVPTYNAFGINAASWKVRFIAAGYNTVEGLVNIQANATTSFDIITMIPGYQPPAAISGSAINAMTNTSLNMSGLTVRIREGVNVTSGPYVTNVGAVTTGSDGSFAITNVPAGNYTMEVSGPGVVTTYRTVVSAGPDTPRSQNIVVSPTVGDGEVRIVVIWGEKPRDVDSHLEYGDSSCKTSSGKKCQVVWNDRCHFGSGTCNNGAGAGNPNYDAALDVDDVTSYGPETITLKGTFWSSPTVSRRDYSLYNWTNEVALSTSGAIVKVFKSSGMVRSYNVSSAQAGRWWQIFCLKSDKSIVDVGQPSCNANDFFNAPRN
ncbi:MAG: carboxypeptidase regulatory-like domain-containing protein [Leptospiraceae bacterium]|nr:carboxypeptidase regulatory-like domain-containing protein [Leptospiraceae bacterium]